MATQRNEFVYTTGEDLPKFLMAIATQGWLIINEETRMISGTQTLYVAYRDI